MKRFYLLAFLVFLPGVNAGAQSFTDSNLPIFIINTDGGVPIPDEPRVLGYMKIIYRGAGERNSVTDQGKPEYLNYNGRINIEIRGSSSQFTDKKQYGFTTLTADNISNNNVSLLGMPAENDWILNGMVFDPALIRDFLCYNLARQIGEYASRTAYCEVIINGSYRGLYLLQEKIKADDHRVDIMKITSSDNYLPELSGGYITKADKTTGGDPVAWRMYSWTGAPVNYIHDLPAPESVTLTQSIFIRNQFDKLEQLAATGNTSVVNGYPSVIDIPSFIDHIIISELSSNADSYQLSTFFHKDRNGKLRAGPIWDNDLTFGNDLFNWGVDRSKSNIWQFSNGDNEGSKFWRNLFNNSTFKCYLSKRWNELIQPGEPLNPSSLEAFIDQTVNSISEAVGREALRWGTAGNYNQRIADIKTFLNERITWITTNIGSYDGCSNIEVPSLVISKIMYNPATSIYFSDDDDLEFIEITNNSNQIVRMDGIYFSGTGLVYQFPGSSFLPPDTSIFLAANQLVFLNKYGFSPYGQFRRHLSNNSQNLVLSDAFGNVIDSVHYYDTVPWPDADNNGYYLKLIDPDLDNNVPENWTSSNDLILSSGDIEADLNLQFSPNPVIDVLKVEASAEIKSVTLFDFLGRFVLSETVNSKTCEIDMRGFQRGIYIISITTPGKTSSGKIFKQ
jgi:hypothetical protein